MKFGMELNRVDNVLVKNKIDPINLTQNGGLKLHFWSKSWNSQKTIIFLGSLKVAFNDSEGIDTVIKS